MFRGAGGADQQFLKAGPGGLPVLFLGAVFAGDDDDAAFCRKPGPGQSFEPLLHGVGQPGQAREETQLHGGGHLVHVLSAVPAASDEFFHEGAGWEKKILLAHVFILSKNRWLLAKHLTIIDLRCYNISGKQMFRVLIK